MRTKTLIIAAALSAAGIVSSLAQSNVYSVNVVGYVNKVCRNTPPVGGVDGLTLLANPLNAATNTVDAMFGSQFIAGQNIQRWTATGFRKITRTATSWLPPGGGNDILAPGEGFFVGVPAAQSQITVTFVGEVLQGTLVNTYAPGGVNGALTLTGNKVPDSGQILTLGMTNIVTGDNVQFWEPPSGQSIGYTKYTKTASGWLPPTTPAAGPQLNVAEGFFVSSIPGFVWTRNFTVQ